MPIYISGERNIRLSDVGQVYHGIVYALSGGEKGSCHEGCADGRAYRKRVWNGKAGECRGDVLFQGLLLDDMKLEDGKMYAEFYTCCLLDK